MKKMAFCLLALSGSAFAGDVLDDPKALCGYFESLGMKAQFQWGPAPQGESYFCQYADEFSGNSTHVRGAQVYVDPVTKTAGFGLSIQEVSGNLVHAEAVDLFQEYARRVHVAQQRELPAELDAALASKAETSLQDGAFTVTTTDAKLWESHQVVGAGWKRAATPEQLAALKSSVSPAEQAAKADIHQRLEARCEKAVVESGQGADLVALKKQVTPLSASRILVEYSNAKGSFICQVCDEMDPKVQCGTMGVMLSYRGSDGSALNLPAEIEQKCVFSLQDRVKDADVGVFIDQEIVKRIKTRAVPNEKRYVYEHELDGQLYRCVVRKSDLNYSIDVQKADGEWRGLVGGIML